MPIGSLRLQNGASWSNWSPWRLNWCLWSILKILIALITIEHRMIYVIMLPSIWALRGIKNKNTFETSFYDFVLILGANGVYLNYSYRIFFSFIYLW